MDDGRSAMVTDSKERQKALAAALAQIEKQFGKGSIMRMAEGQVADIDVISTSSARRAWTSRSASAGFRAGGSSRSTVRVVGQDDVATAGRRRSAEDRRLGRVR